MKKIILLTLSLTLLAVACHKVELKKEVPTVPAASYQPLPK